jgi:hypothetical protein
MQSGVADRGPEAAIGQDRVDPHPGLLALAIAPASRVSSFGLPRPGTSGDHEPLGGVRDPRLIAELGGPPRVGRQSRSPAVADIIGARLAWTVAMISSVSMPCR